MSVFKSQFTRALKVIPSDNCNIPSPYAIVSSITTDTATNQLIDNTVDFKTLNVQAGDIVYNTSANEAATVVGVIDGNTLELNADVAPPGDNYVIYQASSQTGLGNQGCNLMSSKETEVNVITVGGDNVTILLNQYVNCGLQVIKVISVTNAPILTALW